MALINYCTTTYMRSFNTHRTYNTTSHPTLAQVSSHIPTVSGEMNARFASVGITVPITTSPATYASNYLKRLCALKSACIAENSTYLGGNKNESPHADYYCKEYERQMQAIEKNPQILLALIGGGTGATMDSLEYSNVDERRTTEPFARNEDRW